MKNIQKAMEFQKFRFCFVPIEKTLVKRAVFADATFVCNPNLTSHLEYVIAFANAGRIANVLRYVSVKSKRVIRSVPAADLLAAVPAFDYGSTLHATFNEIFGPVVSLSFYMDSKSLFHSLVGLNSTTETRLLIDLFMLCQNYELRGLNEGTGIFCAENAVDALT